MYTLIFGSNHFFWGLTFLFCSSIRYYCTDTSDEELRELFSQHGTVKFVSIPKNRETGESRGFAFVDMASKDECDAAIAATANTMLNGRTIRVNESLPKDKIQKQNANQAQAKTGECFFF